MNKKTIWIVGGGLLQVPAVHAARKLGLRIIVSDRNPNCVCAKLADEFHEIDTRDLDGHSKVARSYAGKISGVFTEGASVERTVAEVAWALNFPFPLISRTVARNIAVKHEMRYILNRALPAKYSVWYSAANNYAAVRQKARFWGKPFILKPSDASGSKGSKKFQHVDEMSRDDVERAQSFSTDGMVLIEELLIPGGTGAEWTEQSVETLWEDGKGYWLNWVDRPFRPDPHFSIEMGHINPANHSVETQRTVEKLVMMAGKVLGMTTGIFKADIFLTDKGPKILETTARLSGGFDSQLTSPMAHGVDYITGALRMALGEPPSWEYFLPKWHKGAAVAAKSIPPGKIVNIDESGAMGAIVLKTIKIGDIQSEVTNCADRHIFVGTTGSTGAIAWNRALEAAQRIKVEVE